MLMDSLYDFRICTLTVAFSPVQENLTPTVVLIPMFATGQFSEGRCCTMATKKTHKW